MISSKHANFRFRRFYLTFLHPPIYFPYNARSFIVEISWFSHEFMIGTCVTKIDFLKKYLWSFHQTHYRYKYFKGKKIRLIYSPSSILHPPTYFPYNARFFMLQKSWVAAMSWDWRVYEIDIFIKNISQVCINYIAIRKLDFYDFGNWALWL